jgi:hypothetical protein
MDAQRPIVSGRSPQNLDEAMRRLSATVREAGECLLDLQHAVERLRLAGEPAFAREVEREASDCIRTAMRR